MRVEIYKLDNPTVPEEFWRKELTITEDSLEKIMGVCGSKVFGRILEIGSDDSAKLIESVEEILEVQNTIPEEEARELWNHFKTDRPHTTFWGVDVGRPGGDHTALVRGHRKGELNIIDECSHIPLDVWEAIGRYKETQPQFKIRFLGEWNYPEETSEHVKQMEARYGDRAGEVIEYQKRVLGRFPDARTNMTAHNFVLSTLGYTKGEHMTDLEQDCENLREGIKSIAARVLKLKGRPENISNGSVEESQQKGEQLANLTLAYRHLEDARMRIGKCMQAIQGGVSILDKSEVRHAAYHGNAPDIDFTGAIQGCGCEECEAIRRKTREESEGTQP